MKACPNCGEEVLESAKFCKHCGKDTTKEQTEKKEEPEQEEEQKEVEPKKEETVQQKEEKPKKKEAKAQKEKSKSKKPKIILFSSIAIILLLIGGYLFGSYQASPEQYIKDFEKAMKDKDTKTLASMLTADKKDVEINEKSLEGIVEYYDSHSSELTSLINNMKMQVDIGNNLTKMHPFDIMKDGKKFLVFDNYSIIINTVNIKVNTNYKDTDIIVNGEVLATSDSDNFSKEVGPLLPGEYVVEAIHDTGIFHLEAEEKVQAMNPGFAEYVNLNLDGSDVMFDLHANRYNDLKSIKLYINGKDTEWNLAKENKVGPLLTDGSMNASFEAELPWGTVRTKDVPLDDRYPEFNLGNSEEFQEEIMEKIIQFNEEFVETFAKAEPENISTATDDVVQDIADNIVANLIAELEYEGAFHGVDFYTDSFILRQDYDKLWKVKVDTITYHEESFTEGDKKAKAEKVEEEIQYELVYDPQSKDWYVTQTDSADLMEEDKMERYKVSDPVVHKSDWKNVRKELEKEIEKEQKKDN